MKSKLKLEIKKISKQFPGVKALSDVDIIAKAGEILGLVGVNGAGKSTLMNVLGGILQPDSGEIRINDELITIKSPKAAEAHGIAFIHQEIEIFDNLPVYENIFISDLKKHTQIKGLPFLDRKKLKTESKKYLNMLGCDINVNTKAGKLAVGEQQMVQIARALSQGGKILLFDEPTSSLSENEKENLFKIIEKLKESNFIIIYISHYLDEIFDICDRVVTLRDGQVTGRGNINELNKKKIINFMIGKDIESLAEEKAREIGDRILEVRSLSGERYPDNVSLYLNKGEVLGVWGLLGSGRTELFRTILGFDKKKSGEILFNKNGMMVPINHRKLFQNVGYLTESRHYDGLFMNLPIWQNITSTYLKKFASKMSFLKRKEERQTALDYIKQVNIKATDENMTLSKLSGGNQQKVIIAKWLLKEPKVLFLDEPTKGVDVGAKAEIQRLIFNRAKEGMSFMVISSEIEEIMSLSDRIIVIHNGEIVSEIYKEEFTKDSLMKGIVGREVNNG